MDNILPAVYSRHKLEIIKKLKDLKNLIISLDGWTDNAGNGVYSFLDLKGPLRKILIDILELHCQRNTPDNILKELKETLK